jgi:hypothetical protein
MTSDTDDLEQQLQENLKLRRELAAEVAKAKNSASQVSRGFPRIAIVVTLIVLAIVAALVDLVLLPGLVSAAEKITLACSGTLTSKSTRPPWAEFPVPSQSIVVDLERGLVMSSFGHFSITEASENSIKFRADFDEPGKFTVGGIDRVAGSAIVTGYKNNEPVSSYNLNCRRTAPMF